MAPSIFRLVAPEVDDGHIVHFAEGVDRAHEAYEQWPKTA
jgi:hypothetical protein